MPSSFVHRNFFFLIHNKKIFILKNYHFFIIFNILFFYLNFFKIIFFFFRRFQHFYCQNIAQRKSITFFGLFSINFHISISNSGKNFAKRLIFKLFSQIPVKTHIFHFRVHNYFFFFQIFLLICVNFYTLN